MPSLSNMLPAKQITTALSAALRTTGFELTADADAIVDPDQRRAVKRAQRVATLLETLNEALSDFSNAIELVEKKLPRKRLMSELEKELTDWNGNVPETAKAVVNFLRQKQEVTEPTEAPSPLTPNPVETSKAFSGQISTQYDPEKSKRRRRERLEFIRKFHD